MDINSTKLSPDSSGSAVFNLLMHTPPPRSIPYEIVAVDVQHGSFKDAEEESRERSLTSYLLKHDGEASEVGVQATIDENSVGGKREVLLVTSI